MTRHEYNAQRERMLVHRLRAVTPAGFDSMQQQLTLLDEWAPGYARDPYDLLDLPVEDVDDEDDVEEVAA